MAEKILHPVHTAAPFDPKTGFQDCVRCGERLHQVDLSAIPSTGMYANPASHFYAPGINLYAEPGERLLMIGDFVEGQTPAIGQLCAKAKTK